MQASVQIGDKGLQFCQHRGCHLGRGRGGGRATIRDEIEAGKLQQKSTALPEDSLDVDARRDAESLVNKLWTEAKSEQDRYEEYLVRFETQRMRAEEVLFEKDKIFGNMDFAASVTDRLKVASEIRRARKVQERSEKKARASKYLPMAEKIISQLVDFAWDLERGALKLGDLPSVLLS